MIYLIIGLLVGFFVALPVGAVAVLCINRTLQYGIKSGFYTGIGVAVADFLYGTLAVFGLVAVSGESLQNQPVLRLVGGLCIMFIGAQMVAKKIDNIKLVDLQKENNFKNAATGALLTISNPVTVLAFISVLSYLNFLLHQVTWIDSIFIVVGIFFGSLIWWVTLCCLALKLKDNLNLKKLKKINLFSGFLIFFFGILLILSTYKLR